MSVILVLQSPEGVPRRVSVLSTSEVRGSDGPIEVTAPIEQETEIAGFAKVVRIGHVKGVRDGVDMGEEVEGRHKVAVTIRKKDRIAAKDFISRLTNILRCCGAARKAQSAPDGDQGQGTNHSHYRETRRHFDPPEFLPSQLENEL